MKEHCGQKIGDKSWQSIFYKQSDFVSSLVISNYCGKKRRLPERFKPNDRPYELGV